MNKPQRRQFIQLAASVVGSAPLVGCGGGGEPDAEAASLGGKKTATAAPTPTPIPTPTPVPTPTTPTTPVGTNGGGPGTGAMQFTLSSAKTQVAAPFCIGFAFRRGDIPAGSTVASNVGSLQVTPRNYWPDGSLKFAQIAGQASLAAGATTVITLRKSAQVGTSSALTLASLKATGVTAIVSCGSLGDARWTKSDWDTPFQTWVSGPQMSSWVYRKPVGTDAHLVAWLEVRLFANGAVEVLPWIENGYLRVASPTNKSATYSFVLGGTSRFSAAIDLKHHQRTPLISGTQLSHWLGADPGVVPRHDAVYMQYTELVPSYRVTVASDAPLIKNLPSTFTPLAKGSFLYDNGAASMAASGYQPAIGLLPEHDVAYLVSGAGSVFASVVRNGYYAGQFGIHYRDEATNRPPRFSQWPTLVIADGQGIKDVGASTTSTYTTGASGGNPVAWDIAHSPSVGYMAYLLTGSFYFMEEVQFAATLNAFQVTDWVRGGGTENYAPRAGYSGASMICLTAVDAVQTRAAAWGFRTLAQALCVTPDAGDPLRAEFLAAVEDNCRYFHQIYVAQPNNPFGWIKPGESYDGALKKGAPWQQDFVTAAWGYAKSMGLPLSSAGARKMDEFFAWKARSVIRRLGTSSEFWYVNANAYNLAISSSNLPDYEGGTGPWLSTDAAVYSATYSAVSAPDYRSTTEGVLGLDFGAAVDAVRGMWANLQPAIAYAVRHGVPGALPAYNRMVGASNWPAVRDAFVARPVWSVMPAQVRPAWMTGKGLNEWFEIPGTAGAGGSGVFAYSGFAMDDRNGEIIIAAAGGHNDSFDNRVVSLGLLSDAPAWTLRKASSTAPLINVPYYPDGLPTSRHLYHSSHVVESLNRVFLFGAFGTYGPAWAFPTVDGFNLTTNQWDPAGTWASIPTGGSYGAVKVRATGDVYTSAFFKFSAASQTWSQPITEKTNDWVRWPIAHDSKRNQLFSLMWGDGQGYGTGVYASRVPLSGNRQYTVSFNPSPALSQFVADAPTYSAMDYDPDGDRFLFYCGQGDGAGRIYVITPNDTNKWDMSILPLAAGSIKPRAVPDAGVQSRFRYVPALKGFVLLAETSANLYFIRTA